MRIEKVCTLEELQPYAEAWNRLAYDAPQGAPMLSHAWVSSFLEHLLGPEISWSCLLALDESGLVGVLPVIGPSRHALMGQCFSAPDDVDVRVGDLLSAEGRETEVVPALLDQLMSEPGFGRLRLGKLLPGSPALRLHDFLPGIRVFSEPDGHGSFFRVEGSYEDALAKLSSSFRGKMKRAGKRLDQLRGARTECVSGDAVGEEHVRAFFELEHSGWKGREGTSILSSPQRTAFFTTLTHRLARAGMLEWQFISGEGRLLAGSMSARTRRKLTGWKLAYDEEQASNSPGIVLILRLLQRAFQGGDIDEIDMVSDYPWYRHLRAERRSYTRLEVSSPRIVPTMWVAVGAMARMASKAARQQVKTSPVLMPLLKRMRGLVAGMR